MSKRERGVGVRPKKAVREEVLRLKEELGKCRSDQWQRAGTIFQQMADLCGHQPPQGGRVIARACRYCHYYGHSSQHCAKRLREQDAEIAKLVAAERAAAARGKGKVRDESILRAEQDVQAARDAGLEGCSMYEWEEGGSGGPCSFRGAPLCGGCRQWRQFMAHRADERRQRLTDPVKDGARRAVVDAATELGHADGLGVGALDDDVVDAH